MKVTEHFLESWDGTRLFYRAWLPEVPARKALILFHRGHEHSARWEEFVRNIDLSDVAIFAWDARGHGRSEGERGFARSVSELARDVDVFARHVWHRYELKPEETIVLAHSLAAVTVGTWIHDYAPKLKGMILATAAFRVKLYLPLAIPALRLRQRVFGDGFVKSYVSGSMLTHDKTEASRYNTDPLIFRQISTRLLLDLNETSKRLVADAAAIALPTLMLAAGRDWVVRLDEQKRFFERLSSAVKRFETFPSACHALFHEKERGDVARCVRQFVVDQFTSNPPRTEPTELAGKSDYTWSEFASLKNGNGGHAGFAIARAGLRLAGRFSSGIATGWRTGFDSGQSLDYIYRNEPAGSLGIGRFIDRSYLNTIGWRGIRQRKQNLDVALKKVVEMTRQENRPVHILDVAAGAGRYVIETVASLADVPISARLRDYVPENVEGIAALANEFGLTNVVAEKTDAFKSESYVDLQPAPTIGIVSGLFELFPPNEMVSTCLTGLARAIPPGGFLIYTNQPWHPQLEFIARVLRNHRGEPWVMRRRTTAEMDALVSLAGFEKTEMQIDQWGMFTVSIARRRK